MYVKTLDVMKTLLDNFRLPIFGLRKNSLFRQFLIVKLFIANHELVGLTVHNVTLAATLQVVLSLFVGAKLLLQIPLNALKLELFALVSTSFR